MPASAAVHSLQSAPAQALPGTWKLAPGRAITLQPATHGILRIAHGQVWATTDGPHGRAPDDSGDHVLEVGRSMWVRAGQRVVIESWSRAGSAYFSWDPVLAPLTVPAAARRPARNWSEVLQPLADLRHAAGLAVQATGRLAAGVAHLLLDLLPARATRAHGAMG